MLRIMMLLAKARSDGMLAHYAVRHNIIHEVNITAEGNIICLQGQASFSVMLQAEHHAIAERFFRLFLCREFLLPRALAARGTLHIARATEVHRPEYTAVFGHVARLTVCALVISRDLLDADHKRRCDQKGQKPD